MTKKGKKSEEKKEEKKEDKKEEKKDEEKTEKKSEEPKRPLTSYFRFANEVRSVIKKDNPTLKVTEIAKEIGKRWKELNPTAQQKYKDAYKEEKIQYDDKMEKCGLKEKKKVKKERKKKEKKKE